MSENERGMPDSTEPAGKNQRKRSLKEVVHDLVDTMHHPSSVLWGPPVTTIAHLASKALHLKGGIRTRGEKPKSKDEKKPEGQ